MSLSSGTRVGSYQIVALIGAGNTVTEQTGSAPINVIVNWTATLQN
jgi:hypothetical protein